MDDHKRTLGGREVIALGAATVVAAVLLPRFLGSNTEKAATVITRGTDALASATQCTLTKELTEGPFYVANEPTRQNITEGLKGMPLIISFRVVDATTCKPSYLRGHQIANAKGVALLQD